MNIYVQDFGWRGAVIVVADNEEEARKEAAQNPFYDEKYGFDWYPVAPGVVCVTIGDT